MTGKAPPESGLTAYVQSCLDRLRGGDEAARDELIEKSCQRLRQLAQKMLRGYERVRRWEETDDVLSGAMLRLHRALQEVAPESPLHFFRLAALQIRRELNDLAKKHFGPLGIGARHDSVIPAQDGRTAASVEKADPTNDPVILAVWTDLHAEVARLAESEREVFELVWYQQLTHAEIADLLQISRRTVIRRWQAACLQLHAKLFEHENVSPDADDARRDS